MKYDLSGAHVLNKFVWSKLQTDLGMTKEQYSGLVPIIPSQQIPVFNEMPTAKPFIVYNYTTVGYDTDIWKHVEQMSYTVYSDDEVQLRRISNLLIDVLRRYDDTAKEVNLFVTDASRPIDSDDRKFDFKWVTVISATGPEPALTEGGRQATGVVVRYSYVYDEDSVSRRA